MIHLKYMDLSFYCETVCDVKSKADASFFKLGYESKRQLSSFADLTKFVSYLSQISKKR